MRREKALSLKRTTSRNLELPLEAAVESKNAPQVSSYE